jgi:hypothetical protein
MSADVKTLLSKFPNLKILEIPFGRDHAAWSQEAKFNYKILTQLTRAPIETYRAIRELRCVYDQEQVYRTSYERILSSWKKFSCRENPKNIKGPRVTIRPGGRGQIILCSTRDLVAETMHLEWHQFSSFLKACSPKK